MAAVWHTRLLQQHVVFKQTKQTPTRCTPLSVSFQSCTGTYEKATTIQVCTGSAHRNTHVLSSPQYSTQHHQPIVPPQLAHGVLQQLLQVNSTHVSQVCFNSPFHVLKASNTPCCTKARVC
jgi:hypothetical protein